MPMRSKDLEFKVRGMDCVEEVSVLKREIGPLVGGAEHLAFDILNAKMTVLPTAASVEPGRIVEAVDRAGMRAEPYENAQPGAGEMSFWQRRHRTIMTTAREAFSAVGFLTHAAVAGSLLTALGSEGLGVGHEVLLVSRWLYAAAVITGVWYVAPRAWIALRRLRPDMNLLMTIAVIGAVAIGEWFEAATVSFLFALSLTLESWSIGRAKRAVEALLEIAPPSVRILRDGVEQEISPAEAVVGAHFLVRSGWVNASRSMGRSFAATAMLTRSRSQARAYLCSKSPVHKCTQYAGTVNGNGVLEVEVTKLAGETTWIAVCNRRAAHERAYRERVAGDCGGD